MHPESPSTILTRLAKLACAASELNPGIVRMRRRLGKMRSRSFILQSIYNFENKRKQAGRALDNRSLTNDSLALPHLRPGCGTILL